MDVGHRVQGLGKHPVLINWQEKQAQERNRPDSAENVTRARDVQHIKK
jgi:hypothetical protein